MKKFVGILVILLFFIPISVDSQQPILLVELDSDGDATVTQLLSAKSIVSSVSVPLISDRISKILATDERGILLKTSQNGNSLNIATLGASAVTLTYKADVTSFDSHSWNVSYEAETETVVALPQLATIVSVSSIPIDIEDNAVIMPPGPVSITYTISEVSSKTFFVLEAGQNFPVEITSASKINDFFKQSNEIRFRISSSSTILVVVPSLVLPNPISASLNGAEVSFNPYYNNGTHNWIRIDPHESGVIEIGGNVRASQVISDTMSNQDTENDFIFITIGIILGVLAVGYVLFRKYFKIGLVRTSGSKGSNRSDISSKHVKKNVKSRQLGIFVLAFVALLFTIPTAFAQVSGDNPALENSNENANAYFALMEKITDAESEASALGELITSNGLNMGKGLTEYADALDQVKALAVDDPDAAAALLENSDGIIDDIYTQLDAQIDSRQNERFDDFVYRATISISFILENASTLGISEAVYDELKTTLDILESGNNAAISAATSETSDIGLIAAMFPEDHPGFGNASPDNKGKGKGIGLGNADNLPPGLQKLPPGIKAKYDIPTDSNLDTKSSDVTNGEGEISDNAISDFFSTLPGFGAASENGQANGQGQGVGLGVGPEAPGIMKKDLDWLYDHGIILDDSWEDSYEDGDFSQGKGQGKGKGKGPPEDKGKSCQGGACSQGQGGGSQGGGSQGGGSQGPP